MKKPLVAVLCTALGAVLIGGSILGYSIWSRSRVQIPVESVSVLQGYWGDNNSTYGVVTTDMTQEVFLKSDMVVDEVLVQEGDTVTVGTPLIQYDTTLINLDLEMQALSIDSIDIKLNAAKQELAQLQAATTYTPPAQEPGTDSDTPVVPDGSFDEGGIDTALCLPLPRTLLMSTGSSNSDPDETVYYLDEYTTLFLKDGTSNVYEVKCAPETVITAAFLNRIRGYSPDGERITSQPMMVVLKIPDKNLHIYLDGYTQEDPGDMEDMDLMTFLQSHNVQTSETPGIISGENPYNGLTPDEKAKQISEKEGSINTLELDRREAVLQYEQLQNKYEDAIVKSTVNGQVKSVGSLEQSGDSDEAFMIISSDDGFYLKSFVNELALDSVSVGQYVSIMNMETGMMGEAEITSISPYPSSNGGDGYSTNPNTSSYPFTAYIEDGSGYKNNQSVQVTIYDNTSPESTPLTIPKAYIRNDNGQPYVYMADENGRLKKQAVKTGKIYYGSYQEILDGLTMDDLIAFPYGKNVREGVKVEMPDTAESY